MKLNVLDNKTDPWYADGLTFTCTQCGNCCTGGPGFVWISDAEITRVAEHLGMSEQAMLRKYCRRVAGKISFKERINGRMHDCIFLTEIDATRYDERAGREVKYRKRICQIYNVRPLQCRTWPFWPENLESPRAWNTAARRCPGMSQGDRHFSREQIEQIRDAEDWPQRPPSSEK